MNPTLEQHRLAETAEQARRDLDELDAQLAAGEIDEETGRRLRSMYAKDLTEAESGLANLIAAEPDATSRSRPRLLIGAAILAVGLAAAVGLVGSFVQERDDGVLQGIANSGDVDLDAISNETMEAVIAQTSSDPQLADQVQRMRFALAERYFEAQEFNDAFSHYEQIIESDPPPGLASAALTRVAWIVWVGNGLTELALQTIDQAIDTDPGNIEAVYVKAQVLWCGVGDPDGAVPLLESVLASDGIDADVRSQVEADLALASVEAAAADGSIAENRCDRDRDRVGRTRRSVLLAVRARPESGRVATGGRACTWVRASATGRVGHGVADRFRG